VKGREWQEVIMGAEDFRFADELGPKRVIHVYEPALGLRGTLVVDNVAAGPAIGGLRMARDVTTEECFRLARSMTLKNAAAGLPHGGGKSILYGDPEMPVAEKEQLIRAMACALGDCEDYIFGPDMGTNESCMAWVKSEIGRAVGLPRELGGIPLDELGATGFGLAHCAEVATEWCGLELPGARVVLQGFGAVGSHAARFLGERGAIIVGVADARGSIADPKGLSVEALLALRRERRSVAELDPDRAAPRDAVIDVECEIWIPAARPDVIRADNVDRLRTKLVIPGANIPMTPDAERTLHERGVVCVPDFVANAGGVICAAMEYHDATEALAFEAIEARIRDNTRQVLDQSRARGETPREAALELAGERVQRAMGYRRWSIF
jgi:glutamate dehydrogenase (NAD(P)+)